MSKLKLFNALKKITSEYDVNSSTNQYSARARIIRTPYMFEDYFSTEILLVYIHCNCVYILTLKQLTSN